MIYKKPPNLKKIHILIADSDTRISEVLRQLLMSMGFANVTRVNNGQKAIDLIKENEIDILITEWVMEAVDGIELVRFMRDQHTSPNLLLPIIMLTGKAERANVEKARDCGITEFVVKPFSGAMLFDRIRKIFDHPRDFVLSESYTGPDRRHQDKIPLDSENLRVQSPVIISAAIAHTVDISTPKIILKDNALSKKANISSSITKVITPEILEKAQSVIDAFRKDSENWIGSDIVALEKAIHGLEHQLDGALERAQDSSLLIKSHAGTFGYDMASNVAFALYVFLCHDYQDGNVTHHLILEKHLEVLKVLLTSRIIDHGNDMEEELTVQLLKMTAKLKESPPNIGAANA